MPIEASGGGEGDGVVTLPIAQAAKRLGRNPSTLRRWIAHGCPCVELGSVGRSHGSRVDLDAVLAWRVAQVAPGVTAQSHDDVLKTAETALMDTLKRDDLAKRAKVSEMQAALVVMLIYERAYRNIKEMPLTREAMPEQLRHLCANYLNYVEQR